MEQELKINIFIDDKHEYDYVKDIKDGITNHMLFHSNSEAWSDHVRETLAASMIDDGNGYRLKGKARPSKKGEIDYHYAQQLEILLRLANSEDSNKYEMSIQSRLSF
jgi:hypothetical protein